MTSTSISNRLSSKWLVDAKTKEDKESLYQSLGSYLNHPHTKRLIQIILDHKNELLNQERNKNQYEVASWPYRQAHVNGNLEIIDLVLNLLKVQDKEDK